MSSKFGSDGVSPSHMDHQSSNTTKSNECKRSVDFGFILTRCMRDEESAVYWIECVYCIRRWYPAHIPIVVIDDGSLPEYLARPTAPVQPWMEDVRIESVPEFPGRGELLPYYYLYHQSGGDKERTPPTTTWDYAITMHDSLFLQAPLPIDPTSVSTICPLFDFDHHWDEDPETVELLSHLPDTDHRDTLIRTYHAKHMWKGYFGMMSVVRREFLVALQDKYNLFALMPYIRTRGDRCRTERILAVAVRAFLDAHRIADGSMKRPSVYGNIHEYTYSRDMYWCFSWTEYQYLVAAAVNHIAPTSKTGNQAIPVIKVWSGR
jgi:hypothetical protein